MDYLIVLFSFIFASTFLHFFYTISRRSRKNLPPGPSPLPIFGSLHLLGKLPHKSLFNLSQIYGPIMCLKLGKKDVIVISSAEIASEALQKQDLVFSTNRATPASVKAQDHHIHSVVFLPISSNWRNIRRIMNTNIFSNNKLDCGKNLRSKKIEELVEYCRRKSLLGEAIDIGQATFRTSLNLLANTIFSKDLTDPFSDSVKEFKELVWNIMVEAGKPNLVDYFPFLEKFDPMRIRHRLEGYFGEILELFGRLIEERLEQKRSQSSVSDDVLDVLLNACRVEDYPQQMDKRLIQHICLVCN
ncbi:oxygenase [Lithospermum erythrorhizon]|uniref:Oxygenase n=1 Tax=Lithospermum erythrorhizon TaxID=34254 RepID=A0AAV3RXF0_LITER